VAQAAASARRATTVFGGRLTREGAVTMGLIGVCVGLFLTVSVLGLAGGLSRWGIQPAAIALGDQEFRLLTSTFMHANLLHIGFNMYVLFMLGPPLERLLGHGRFLALFLLSGLGGAVASYAFSPVRTLSVGASGAVFGLMAAWIVVSRRLQADASQVVVLLAINVALGFFLPGIDWRAHLGGALIGAVVALVLTSSRGREAQARVGRQALALAVVVVALGVVVAWRTEQIRAMVLG
jgi:membrane associated rhomboid family serine protease